MGKIWKSCWDGHGFQGSGNRIYFRNYPSPYVMPENHEYITDVSIMYDYVTYDWIVMAHAASGKLLMLNHSVTPRSAKLWVKNHITPKEENNA